MYDVCLGKTGIKVETKKEISAEIAVKKYRF